LTKVDNNTITKVEAIFDTV